MEDHLFLWDVLEMILQRTTNMLDRFAHLQLDRLHPRKNFRLFSGQLPSERFPFAFRHFRFHLCWHIRLYQQAKSFPGLVSLQRAIVSMSFSRHRQVSSVLKFLCFSLRPCLLPGKEFQNAGSVSPTSNPTPSTSPTAGGRYFKTICFSLQTRFAVGRYKGCGRHISIGDSPWLRGASYLFLRVLWSSLTTFLK